MDAATEDDLRAALRSVVPDDLDATGFRNRLDRLVLEATPPSPEIVPIELPERSMDAGVARRRRPRTALAATLAACAAAAAAIVVAALPHGHRTGTAATSRAAVAPAVRAMLFPGTTVLGTYVGRGSRTFAIAPRTIPAHFEYVAYGICHGSGSLGISGTITDACGRHNGVSFGTSGAVDHGRLIVTADRATSWQVTLTLSPQARTNAELSTPVDADMHGPDNAVRRSGRGNGTAHFAAAPSGAGFTTYELHLVCHGTGVTLPALSALSAPGAKSLVTKTCFADHEYRWTGVRLTLPAAIDVRAAPDTTWTIVIDGM